MTEREQLIEVGAEACYEEICSDPRVREHWSSWADASDEIKDTYRVVFSRWLDSVDAARFILAGRDRGHVGERAAAEVAGPEPGLAAPSVAGEMDSDLLPAPSAAVDPNGCGDPECHPGCRNYPGPQPSVAGEQP